jgi:PTH1 family peptidyl-tRNA hydrolase
MKLIIGLGNPGSGYEKNRHNVGHLFVDFFQEKLEGVTLNVKIFKTECFMNDSGSWVAEKTNFFKIAPENLFVVHDDLDIKFGEYKIQRGVGPKIHYGINSIEENLGTKDFWRVRIGVDARQDEFRIPGEKYVLENFSPEEITTLQKVFQPVREDLLKLLT